MGAGDKFLELRETLLEREELGEGSIGYLPCCFLGPGRHKTMRAQMERVRDGGCEFRVGMDLSLSQSVDLLGKPLNGGL